MSALVLSRRTPLYHVSMFFFFSSRRRHTRCSRDWSSDVCSSDLVDKRVYGKLPVTQLQHFPKPLRSADYQGKTWICLHLRLFERLPIPLDTRQEWKDTSFLPWSCR